MCSRCVGVWVCIGQYICSDVMTSPKEDIKARGCASDKLLDGERALRWGGLLYVLNCGLS